MPFREKSAWVMAAIIAIVAGLYAAMVAPLSGHVPALPILIGTVVALAILSVFGQIAIAVLSPKDAGAAADERDRQVSDRAASVSGTVQTVGIVLAMGTFLMGHGGYVLFHAVFASLFVSQFCEYALTIWYYRRGV